MARDRQKICKIEGSQGPGGGTRWSELVLSSETASRDAPRTSELMTNPLVTRQLLENPGGLGASAEAPDRIPPFPRLGVHATSALSFSLAGLS